METSTNIQLPQMHRDASGAFLSNVRTDTWRVFRDHEFPPRRFVIEPVLYERQVAMVYAATGVGKTWFTLSLAVTAASGRGANFLGFHSDGDGERVLLVDGEMDAEDLKERIDLVIRAIGADQETVDRNLIIMSRQHQSLTNDFPDIADETWQDNLLRYCKSKKIKLLVLDNLSTLAPCMEDENSATKASPVNKMLLKAKQADVACILVHHANKTGQSYRGSSVMVVALDLMIALKRPENYTHVPDETAFAINFDKIRGRLPGEITAPRTVVFASTKDGQAAWREDEHPATKGVQIKQLLDTLKYPTQRALAVAMGTSPGTLSKWIDAAIIGGILTREEVDECLKKAKEMRKALEETDADDQHSDTITEDLAEETTSVVVSSLSASQGAPDGLPMGQHVPVGDDPTSPPSPISPLLGQPLLSGADVSHLKHGKEVQEVLEEKAPDAEAGEEDPGGETTMGVAGVGNPPRDRPDAAPDDAADHEPTASTVH